MSTDNPSSALPIEGIPEGFKVGGFAPYSRHIGPLMYKRIKHEDGSATGYVGVMLEAHHIGGNNRGHGGLLLTLLDEAMGMNAAMARNKNRSSPYPCKPASSPRPRWGNS